MFQTCKNSTAATTSGKLKRSGYLMVHNHKEWSYGKKCQNATRYKTLPDRGLHHHQRNIYDRIVSGKDLSYTLGIVPAKYATDANDNVFENSYALYLIDTRSMLFIVHERLSTRSRFGIDLRNEYQ